MLTIARVAQDDYEWDDLIEVAIDAWSARSAESTVATPLVRRVWKLSTEFYGEDLADSRLPESHKRLLIGALQEDFPDDAIATLPEPAHAVALDDLACFVGECEESQYEYVTVLRVDGRVAAMWLSHKDSVVAVLCSAVKGVAYMVRHAIGLCNQYRPPSPPLTPNRRRMMIPPMPHLRHRRSVVTHVAAGATRVRALGDTIADGYMLKRKRHGSSDDNWE
jgi:hypothetical protein